MAERDPKTGRFIKKLPELPPEWPPVTVFTLPQRAKWPFLKRCKATLHGRRCLFIRGHETEHGCQSDYGMGWWE